jgi:hypothetical protein
VNYTGCDSLYSAAADANGAYFGGHESGSQMCGGAQNLSGICFLPYSN